MMLEIKSEALCMLSKTSSTELFPSPLFEVVKSYVMYFIIVKSCKNCPFVSGLFYKFAYVRYFIIVESCKNCPFVSGLFHLA
jgi:hypothetical protein